MSFLGSRLKNECVISWYFQSKNDRYLIVIFDSSLTIHSSIYCFNESLRMVWKKYES